MPQFNKNSVSLIWLLLKIYVRVLKCRTHTHLPGNLEGVQGTELGTYPCLVAVTTSGVPRR